MKHIALLLFAAVAASGQATQNTTIQPDCWIPFSFTAAASFPATPVLNGPGDNRQKGCSAWTFKYQSDGFSGLTITVQSGESASTTVSFGTYAGTVITGANPMTSTSGAEATFKNATAAISWVRVTLSGLTGSGTVSGVLYGFRNNSAAVNSSGSGNCPNASANAVLKSDGTNCVASGFTDNATTISATEALDFGGAPTFEVPNSGAPGTTIFGQIAGDNNAWAASRGAAQWFDGTANTYIVGALASDTPTNGQVPTWNTGGTITWETVSGFSWTNGATGRICYYVDATHCDGSAILTFNGSQLTIPKTFQTSVVTSANPSALSGYATFTDVAGGSGPAPYAFGMGIDAAAGNLTGYTSIVGSLVTDNSAATNSNLVAYEAYMDKYNTGGWTVATGFGATIINEEGGTLGDVAAFRSRGPAYDAGNYGAGTITTYSSFYAVAPNNAGTYGNIYGLRIADQSALTASTNNHAINYGAGKFIVDKDGNETAVGYRTANNCADSAGAAACGSAAAGAFVVDAAGTSTVVSTTAVTANSEILVFFDASLSTRLGITCNSTVPALYGVTARTAGTSFTLTASAPVTNPACFNFWVIN